VAGTEPVTSPDQHKPTPIKGARIAGTISAILLVLMAFFGNHEGNVEKLWLCGIAAGIIAILVADAVLRRNGLKNP
jgi:ABC-type Fe3+-siderophore transport system permease subunit